MLIVWVRNLLFVGLCLLGGLALAAGLLSGDRIEQPATFDPELAQSPGFRSTVDAVNRQFAEHLRLRELQPADRASDLAIARRLSLGLTGTIPSLEEIRALEAQPPAHRTQWWISHLLEDRRSADYVAERLARAYVGTENGPFIIYRRRRFVSWLSDRLLDNDPYNKIVSDLIAGTGLWTDSPGVNFLTVTSNPDEDSKPDPIRLAARTTRAFLGMRIDCLQCHDDQLGTIDLGASNAFRPGQQSDFHKLASFFADAEMSLTGVDDSENTYRYKYLDEEKEEEIEPAVPFLSDILTSEGTEREQLARWVTNPRNKPFARAMVNRVWAIMFGRPLVEPIDSIPLHGPFPPGLETLAEDFVHNDYDLQRLIRLIAATAVYQRDSRAEFKVSAQHEDNWAVFPITRLRPEQVAGAMIQSCSLTTIDANAHIFSQLARYFQQNEFIERYGDSLEDEFAKRSGTVTQRLLMMNGSLIKDRTDDDLLFNAATQIAQLSPNPAKAVETAYLAVMTRRPTPREKRHFTKFLNGTDNEQRSQQAEDLYWILLNSTEFSWNH